MTKQGRQSDMTIIDFLHARGVYDKHINEPCPYTSDKCPKLRELAAPYKEHSDFRRDRWLS